MAKEKKVSVNDFEKVMEDVKQDTVQIDWHGVDVTITPLLSLENYLAFVQEVVSICFDEDTGDFIPEVRDFAIKRAVLHHYANFRLPENTARCYDMIYSTDAVASVLGEVNRAQFDELCRGIDKRLAYLAETSVKKVERKLNEAVSEFEEACKQLETMFAGVSPDDVAGMVRALGAGTFDEEKIAHVVLDNMRAPEVEKSEG